MVPENYVKKDVFDAVSVYIIPKSELYDKVISVNVLSSIILGYPVAIDNPKYDRNALIFNICLVCDDKDRVVRYESVVRKISEYFVGLEMECGFLSNQETKAQLPGILENILHGLNKTGTCTIQINDANTLYLRALEITQNPPQVEDYHVPVFVVNRNVFVYCQWDLTTQQILPYIDGFNHIARIASETDVEISLVKSSVQNMIYYGIAKLIDIFQYSNVYTVTPEIQRLYEDKALQDECLKYVARHYDFVESFPPKFRDVFNLYCIFSHGVTVKDLCVKWSPHSLHIDERKLVQFGTMKGFLRRLYKYPNKISGDFQGSKKFRPVGKFLNGLHHTDEICCQTGLKYQELDERIESDPTIVCCWK
ncbi:Nitrogen permease regulator-like 2, variant 2 [Chamberlinius hualienensis]